jgi:hypothetical protein
MKKLAIVAAAALGLGASAAQAASVVNIGGTGSTGASFTAQLTYNEVSSQLQVALKNTTASSLAGNITAFVFNIAGSQAYEVLNPDPTDLDPSSKLNWWSLTTAAQLSDFEAASPFGQFEGGVGEAFKQNQADFHGGGNGQDSEGVGSGETGVFVFDIKLAGTNTGAGNGLTASSFISELSTGGSKSAAFVVRFKGLNPNDNSDKVPGGPPVVPLPASAWAGIAMMGAIGAGKWIRRRKA